MLPDDILDLIVKEAIHPRRYKEVRRWRVTFHCDTGLMYPAWGCDTTKGGLPLIVKEEEVQHTGLDDSETEEEDEADYKSLVAEFTRVSQSPAWELIRVDRERVCTEFDELNGELEHMYENLAYFGRLK